MVRNLCMRWEMHFDSVATARDGDFLRKAGARLAASQGHMTKRTVIPFAMDCTLEMRQPGWAHFAGKGLQSEAEAILTEVPADGC